MVYPQQKNQDMHLLFLFFAEFWQQRQQQHEYEPDHPWPILATAQQQQYCNSPAGRRKKPYEPDHPWPILATA